MDSGRTARSRPPPSGVQPPPGSSGVAVVERPAGERSRPSVRGRPTRGPAVVLEESLISWPPAPGRPAVSMRASQEQFAHSLVDFEHQLEDDIARLRGDLDREPSLSADQQERPSWLDNDPSEEVQPHQAASYLRGSVASASSMSEFRRLSANLFDGADQLCVKDQLCVGLEAGPSRRRPAKDQIGKK